MTTEQFTAQLDEMLPRAIEGMRQRMHSAITSGVIDIDAEPDDSYRLAKALLCAVLRCEVDQWRGPTGLPSGDERNMMRFI